MRMRKPSARRRVNERGSILGMSAIAMLAILGAVGLGIDISHTYSIAAELQNAADAAALAGASALNGGPDGISRAVTRATATMNRYEFNHTSLVSTDFNVAFAVNLSEFNGGGAGSSAGSIGAELAKTIRFVKVTIPAKTVTTVAARAVLQAFSNDPVSEFAVSRSAVAGQSWEINTIGNALPIAPVQDLTNGFTAGSVISCSDMTAKSFKQGCVYRLDWVSSNSPQLEGGNFVILNLTSSRAIDLRERMAIGVDENLKVGDIRQLDTGAATGQVQGGINTRLDDFQGQGNLDPAKFPPDLNVKESITYEQYTSGSTGGGVYQAPGHTPAQADRRVLIVPIVNASSFVGNPKTVTIATFGAFFMRDKMTNGNNGNGNGNGNGNNNAGGFIVEYIGNHVVIGSGSSDGGAGVPGLTIPVLYR